MLGDEELLAWFQRVRLSECGRSIVRQVRSSDPARRVGGGCRNVSGRYPSRKMGITIQFESHRVELARIYELEHDPGVLEYWDQPPSFKLDYKSARGRRVVAVHTPDYFVIRADGAGWEECKTEEDLVHWTQKSPNRYCQRDGVWYCPPGEDYAQAFGLTYCVRSSREVDWMYQRNIQFLEDYLRDDRTPVSSGAKDLLIAHVNACPGISLQELLSVARDSASCDDAHYLIALGELYVDLHSSPLAQPGRVEVFADARAAADHRRDAQVAVEAPRSHSSDVEADFRLSLASEADLRQGNHRYEIVRRLLNGEKPEAITSISPRTSRRWTAMFKRAEIQYGSGFLGLLPMTRQRGNRRSKLPEASRELIKTVIREDYETPKQKSMFASWCTLQTACRDQGILAPSYQTFRLAAHARAGYSQTLSRMGTRAAYQKESFYWELELRTPRHGDRPLEIAHVDHTELDVELVCSTTGRNLGRPWLSLLTDAFSRRVLAFALSFDPPSYRSCMMIIRECVARHNRLPQIFVVDGGVEFGSIYFETVLARYECTKKCRPPAKARFGSVVERLFGTCNSLFVHNLRGNTQIMRQVRQITASVNPRNAAVWTLAELHGRLSQYLYEVYDTLDHPALGQSPRDAYEVGMTNAGQRPWRRINNDREFFVITLPTTPKGTSAVLPGRGVKIHYIYYWSDIFHNPEVEGKQVPIRYDPFNIGLAFAFANGQWVQCHSEYYAGFSGHTERELMLATQELRRQRRKHASQRGLSAKTIGDFLQSVEARESLLAQRLHDQQATGVCQEPKAVFDSSAVTDSQTPARPFLVVAPSGVETRTTDEEYETYGAF